jgi:hypothetical protein
MSASAETLFMAANAQYQTSIKWRWLTFLLLLFLQFFIVRPYVELSREKAGAEAVLKNAAAMAGPVGAFTQRLDAHRQEIAGRVAAATQALEAELACAFGALNEEIAGARDPGRPPPVAARTRGALPAEVQIPNAPPPLQVPNASIMAAQRPMLQAQMPPIAQMPIGARALHPWPCLDLGEAPALPVPELAAAQGASSTDALIAALQPFIEREVVQPRLALFNAAWSDEARPLAEAIEGTRANLAETRRTLAAEAGGDDRVWLVIDRALEQLAATTQGFAVRTGDASAWWRTTEGKGEVMRQTQLEAARGTETALAPIREAERRLDATIAAQKASLAVIDAELKAKAAELDRLRESLAGAVGPVQWFAIDLKTAAPQFTLFLGLALAFAVAWPAIRLAELAAIAAASESLAPDETVRIWLAARRSRDGAEPAATLLRDLFLLAWIAVAGYDLAGRAGAYQIAIAAAAVAAAVAYDWRVRRSVAGLVRTEAA